MWIFTVLKQLRDDIRSTKRVYTRTIHSRTSRPMTEREIQGTMHFFRTMEKAFEDLDDVFGPDWRK